MGGSFTSECLLFKERKVKGQQVFSEKLGSFSGSYSKEVHISKNPKGAYFIRVEQGQRALVKKVVVVD